MPEPIETLEGWYALHDFRSLDWEKWWGLSDSARTERLEVLKEWSRAWQSQNDKGTAGYGAYQIVGHKADFLWLYLCPTVDDLAQARSFFRSRLWAGLMRPAWSYLSVVELSQYMAKDQDAASPYLQSRLHPKLPQSPYLSFYPMSKRRQGEDNWYMLTQAQRREMMKAHGQIGHHHRARVSQIITGSQGLDDWEWGVTLLANDPIAFKKIVYEMRFDESTARFGEFGPFYTGIRLDLEHLDEWFAPRSFDARS